MDHSSNKRQLGKCGNNVQCALVNAVAGRWGDLASQCQMPQSAQAVGTAGAGRQGYLAFRCREPQLMLAAVTDGADGGICYLI